MAAAAVKQFLTATQKKNSNADSRNITTVFRESTPKNAKGVNLGEYNRKLMRPKMRCIHRVDKLYLANATKCQKR